MNYGNPSISCELLLFAKFKLLVQNIKQAIALHSINLPKGTELVVTIDRDLEKLAWSKLSLNGLNRAYADYEPEYEYLTYKGLNTSKERM
jgi:hypothetical protein